MGREIRYSISYSPGKCVLGWSLLDKEIEEEEGREGMAERKRLSVEWEDMMKKGEASWVWVVGL